MELKKSVRRELRSIPEDSFQEALSKLPMRWRKCVANQGEYFEGRGVEPPRDPHFDIAPVPSSDEDLADGDDEETVD